MVRICIINQKFEIHLSLKDKHMQVVSWLFKHNSFILVFDYKFLSVLL